MNTLCRSGPWLLNTNHSPTNHSYNCPHTLLNTVFEKHSTLFLISPQVRFKVICSSFFFSSCSTNSSGIHYHLSCHALQVNFHFFSLFLFFSSSLSASLSLSLSFSLLSKPIEDKNCVLFTFVSAAHTKVCLINIVELN